MIAYQFWAEYANLVIYNEEAYNKGPQNRVYI